MDYKHQQEKPGRACWIGVKRTSWPMWTVSSSTEIRGTLRHPARNTWYELDGFIIKQEQRHYHARRIRTVNECSHYDHEPKMFLLKIKTRRIWRNRGDPRKKKIAWEKLRDAEKREEFNEKTRQRYEIHQQVFQKDQDNWNTISDILGRRVIKSIENSRKIWHEEEISQMKR